jgi:hypothetical protein
MLLDEGVGCRVILALLYHCLNVLGTFIEVEKVQEAFLLVLWCVDYFLLKRLLIYKAIIFTKQLSSVL